VGRADLYREAERILLGECPIVPLFHDAALHLVRRDVRGLAINELGIYYAPLDEAWRLPPHRETAPVTMRAR